MDVARSAPIAPRTPVPAAPAPAPRPAAKSYAKPSPAAATGLWDLLTPEEQEFFARARALGPLTYGPPRAASQAAPLGGRIDVKG